MKKEESMKHEKNEDKMKEMSETTDDMKSSMPMHNVVDHSKNRKCEVMKDMKK